MPFDFMNLAGQLLADQQPNTRSNEQFQQLQTKTQMDNEQLQQAALQTQAMSALAPLNIEAQKAELQGKIDEASLHAAVLPYRQQLAKNMISDSFTTGSNPTTGNTGYQDLDAQSKQIQQEALLAHLYNPSNGAILSNAARAQTELRKEGQGRRVMEATKYSQKFDELPLESVISEAEMTPNDPISKAVIQKHKENPDAKVEDYKSMIARSFNATPIEAEELKMKDEQREQSLQIHSDNMKTQQQLNQERIQDRQDRQQTALDAKADSQNTTIAAKADKRSNDKMATEFTNFDKVNKDYRPNGTGTTIKAIRNLEDVTGGQPVNFDTVKHVIAGGKDVGDAQMQVSQIEALNTLQAQLSSAYKQGGQKSVQQLLGSEKPNNILANVSNQFTAWLGGGTNVKLNGDKEVNQFSELVSRTYNVMARKAASDQIAPITNVFSNRSVLPAQRVDMARKVLDSNDTLAATKGATLQYVAKDLMNAGQLSDDDSKVVKNALRAQSANISDVAKRKAQQDLLGLYEDKMGGGMQAPQPSPGVLVPSGSRGGMQAPQPSPGVLVPSGSRGGMQAPQPSPGSPIPKDRYNTPSSLAGIPAQIPAAEQNKREDVRRTILTSEVADNQRILADPGASLENKNNARNNIDLISKELKRYK